MAITRQIKVYRRWFSSLKDLRAKARIDVRFRRLSLGNPGDVKRVGAGVSELRIYYGPGYRIYFKQTGSEIVVLLNGGEKSSLSKDIERAKELAAGL